jgi:hypothetical protein
MFARALLAFLACPKARSAGFGSTMAEGAPNMSVNADVCERAFAHHVHQHRAVASRLSRPSVTLTLGA